MDIKVNELQWNSLSQGEREQLGEVITTNFKNASIVPTPATEAASVGNVQIENFVRDAACNMAQAAAVVACATIGGPIAVAVCIAAAQAAGDACRNA